MFVAPLPVAPHSPVPGVTSRFNVTAVEVNVPKSATADGLIVIRPAIVVAAARVFVPLFEKVRLLYAILGTD